SLLSCRCPLPFPFLPLITPPPPKSTLFPYTTLFRSITVPTVASYNLGTSWTRADFPEPVPPMMPMVSPERICRSISDRQSRSGRSEEHTSELQSRFDLVCRLLLEKKKKKRGKYISVA